VNKHIILCADDYAQNPAISQGIINLIAQKRLTAVSCLTTSRYWPEHAAWLKPYNEQIDIGLHFNLTMGSPSGDMPQLTSHEHFPAISKIIVKAYSGKLAEQEIYAELNRQLDQFEQALGKLPNFIDGHQHVHALPVIRNALLRCYQERFKAKNVWIRNICPAATQQLLKKPAAIKKGILYLLGGKALKQLLVKSHTPHNSSFAGIYNFNTSTRYSEFFPLFLQALTNNGMIMCHPALASNDSADPIAASRLNEYNYFKSDIFLEACQHQQINLSRFNAKD